MLKNNKFKNVMFVLYLFIALGICSLPAVMMPFTDTEKTSENRELSTMPKFRTEDGKINLDFFYQFETYFSDHYSFREKLVTLNGSIMGGIFNTSPNNDVIIGKGDWLFYNYTIDDYTATHLMSYRGINNICRNLELMAEYCENYGADFVFVPAPNKNSIYPEFMPERYYVTDADKNLHRVYSKLAETSVKCCDLEGALLKSKGDKLLYHQTDTHWNNYGANIGREAMLNTLGKSFEHMDFTNTSYTWKGDLYKMLFPSGTKLDLQFDYADDLFTYNYVGRVRNMDDLTIKTVCDNAEGSLLMYRDSFGAANIPFMAESFASAEFSRIVPYKTESIASGEIDTVILEIVERNLPNLQTFAPIMPAPIRGGSGSFLTPRSYMPESDIFCEISGDYLHIYGILDDDFFESDDVRIYVTINDTVYEAFHAYEKELLGESSVSSSDNGFSLFVPYLESAEIWVTTYCDDAPLYRSESVEWGKE